MASVVNGTKINHPNNREHLTIKGFLMSSDLWVSDRESVVTHIHQISDYLCRTPPPSDDVKNNIVAYLSKNGIVAHWHQNPLLKNKVTEISKTINSQTMPQTILCGVVSNDYPNVLKSLLIQPVERVDQGHLLKIAQAIFHKGDKNEWAHALVTGIVANKTSSEKTRYILANSAVELLETESGIMNSEIKNLKKIINTIPS